MNKADLKAFRGSPDELAEYQDLITEQKNLKNRISKLSMDVDFERKIIGVIDKENDRARYDSSNKKLQKYEGKLAKLLCRMEDIESRLSELRGE